MVTSFIVRLLICLTVVDVADTALAARYGGGGGEEPPWVPAIPALPPCWPAALCHWGWRWHRWQPALSDGCCSQAVSLAGDLQGTELPECEASSPSPKGQGVMRSQPSQWSIIFLRKAALSVESLLGPLLGQLLYTMSLSHHNPVLQKRD